MRRDPQPVPIEHAAGLSMINPRYVAAITIVDDNTVALAHCVTVSLVTGEKFTILPDLRPKFGPLASPSPRPAPFPSTPSAALDYYASELRQACRVLWEETCQKLHWGPGEEPKTVVVEHSDGTAMLDPEHVAAVLQSSDSMGAPFVCVILVNHAHQLTIPVKVDAQMPVWDGSVPIPPEYAEQERTYRDAVAKALREKWEETCRLIGWWP